MTELSRINLHKAYLRAKEKHNTWLVEINRVQKENSKFKDEALWKLLKILSSPEEKDK